jgi:hypothetical protein
MKNKGRLLKTNAIPGEKFIRFCFLHITAVRVSVLMMNLAGLGVATKLRTPRLAPGALPPATSYVPDPSSSNP